MSKRILILTASFGEGHNTAARNLEAALRLEGAAEVETVDLFQVYGRVNEWSRRAYLTAINRLPLAWQGIYFLLDKTPLMEWHLPFLAKARRALAEKIAAFRPDAVVSVYPVYAFLLRGLPGAFRRVTVVTDSISINSLWYRVPSDWYLVPNEETAAVLREAGVPAEKLRVFGFPVQPAFARPEEAPPLPDLSAGGRPRILYVINSGKQKAPLLIARLLERAGWDLTVTVGRDEALHRRISAQVAAAGAEGRVRVLGWTKEMPQLLLSHHVLLSKAGGATVQEAVAARCPMIVNQVVPGQEEGNYELLRRNQAGVLASRPADIAAWLDRLFAQEGRLWSLWRRNIAAISRPRSALDSARFILELPDRAG
ncbi:MAG: hypothetical protein PW734_02880 [Verrucomicrobium sp.]|nr:hypothetical protein [Verrucomicrobium sp.]